MSFDSDIDAFIDHMNAENDRVHDESSDELFRSVVHGSEITGSPGQPVRTGKLRDSWTMEKGEHETVISTDLPYAQAVEENWSGVAYENGGPHSEALTEAGYQRIVNMVADK